MDIEAQSSNQKTLQCLRSVHLPRLVPCQQIVGLTFSNCVVIGKQESWERARQRRVYRRMYTLSETRNEASHRLASSLKSRDTQVVPAITSSGHKVDLCGHRAISKTLRYISLRVYFWTTTNMHASLVVRVCIDKPQGIRNFQENESEIEREREISREKERERKKENEKKRFHRDLTILDTARRERNLRLESEVIRMRFQSNHGIRKSTTNIFSWFFCVTCDIHWN